MFQSRRFWFSYRLRVVTGKEAEAEEEVTEDEEDKGELMLVVVVAAAVVMVKLINSVVDDPISWVIIGSIYNIAKYIEFWDDGWKRAFPSRRIQSSHRFPYGYLVTTSPQSKTPPWYAPISPPKAFVALV